jgi:shikimate 5-dehydrogenase
LLGQALEAFELWTGVPAQVDAMRMAMNQGLETGTTGA